jgi:hypothetical protein
VAPEARTELERVRRRWAELPLARAAEAAPHVRAVLVELAARTAPGAEVPDLGVEVLGEQLAVLVWDAYAAERGDGVTRLLTELRHTLG